MRFNLCVRTIKIQKDRKLQVHFIGKSGRRAGHGKGKWVQSVGTTKGVGEGKGEVVGGGRTKRDEPPFINLDRLLNPGFDETPGSERTYTYVTARRCYAYTHARKPVLVSR